MYDDDLGRLADSRSGDVIAYASALATRKELDSAFLGGAIDRQGGLRKLAMVHAHLAHPSWPRRPTIRRWQKKQRR